VKRRELGRTGLSLSEVTFGSMRLDAGRMTEGEACALLVHLLDHGVTSFHCSPEYESHRFFCASLRRARRERPGVEVEIIAKVAAPHFEDARFSSELLEARVESLRDELGVERIAVLQWLLRTKPISDGPRLAMLRESRSEIEDALDTLVSTGRASVITSFPYSGLFAETVLELRSVRGLATYLNLVELETVALLDRMFARGQGLVALRPLAAGTLARSVKEQTALPGAPHFDREAVERALADAGVGPSAIAHFALRFPLLHPAVASVVVSISSLAHADDVLGAVSDLRADAAEFHRVAGILLPR
jgi:aryl-alcohol dehydrogenase-like predicted oxidoreductase